MNAYLFSVGESTTDLAQWSLERLGFKVHLMMDGRTSLAEKYAEFLDRVKGNALVLRADADVICTRGTLDLWQLAKKDPVLWMTQGRAFCYMKRDLTYTAPMILNNNAISAGRLHIREFMRESRPETALTRIKEFFEPRRFMATDIFTGIHGYRQFDSDVERVKRQKEERGQLRGWDHELIEAMNTFDHEKA